MVHSYSLGSVNVELPPAERFAQFLRGHGKRLTPQRQIIVEQVFSHHDHFDADELMEHLRDWISQRKVSRPTVYRTLSELVEAGMLRCMILTDRSIYEHEYGYPRHDHLCCQICNRLMEFHSDELDRICAAVAEEYQFQITGHRIFVLGICDPCRQRKRKGERTKDEG
jgi:Fur family ferric uptake transcriptional regulator